MLIQSQGLFSFSCYPTGEEAGGAQGARRGQNQADQRNVSYGVMLTNKSWGKGGGKGGRAFSVMSFVFP